MRTQQHRGAKRAKDDPEADLGPCCGCRKTDKTVRNILMLPKLAPLPGTGWGCAVCRLPCNGALAVVCDACLAAHPDFPQTLADVCYGYTSSKRRVSYASLSDEVFEHDPRLHAGFLPEGE